MKSNGIAIRLASAVGLGGAVLVFVSCAVSQQRLGIHYLGNGQTAYGMVSSTADGLTRSIEEQFLRALVSYDVAAMRATFSPQLARQVSEDNLREVMSQIRKEYALNGRFELQPLVGWRLTSLDEGVRSERI